MRFYNFGNQETYHFVMWLLHSGQVDPRELVTKAFDKVESNSLYELGMDPSTCARDELGGLLNALLEDRFNGWAATTAAPLLSLETDSIQEYEEAESRYAEDGSLFMPIVVNAVNRIDTFSAAHALLIWADKWAPDRERPTAR